MKTIILIILFTGTSHLFAQTDPVNNKTPRYCLQLTTMNDNMLKGLLLDVKDTSLIIYPGKFKEWEKGIKYKPVEFGYSNILELELKRKYHPRKRYFINGSRSLFTEFKKIPK